MDMKEKIINKCMKIKPKNHIPSKFTAFSKESSSAVWEQYTNGVYVIIEDPVFVDELATNWVLAMSETYNNQYNGEYDNK